MKGQRNMDTKQKNKTRKKPVVYFVGAGPGDPELITLKGRKLLDAADVVIYAGSLVNPAVLDGIRAKIYDSATMHLDEIITVMKQTVAQGGLVVRLHTGDTSFYSAISEQIERLRKLQISYEVVPGVSSALAGAAALGQELTIPEISQTVIFTRIEGRTPVPKREKLATLAKHRATMVIFLSVGMIEKVVQELMLGYPEATPVIVVEKASWPEQKIVRGTLETIAGKVKKAGIRKTALIYVGESLQASSGKTGKTSKLYDMKFKHEYRN
jgi:precorrin-4/cobalt-precorrin-4 C11-methyltransferase